MHSFILKSLIPFAALLCLLFLLWHALFHQKPSEAPSPLIGTTLPQFSLPDLFRPTQLINENEFKGRLIILNVWASWCYACELEQAMLMKMSKEYPVAIYGLDYKDKSEDAKQWLSKNGNPFRRIIKDEDGELAIDLGIYGTPETFIISPHGKIVYRHVGIIDQKTWNNVLLPLLKKYRA